MGGFIVRKPVFRFEPHELLAVGIRVVVVAVGGNPTDLPVGPFSTSKARELGGSAAVSVGGISSGFGTARMSSECSIPVSARRWKEHCMLKMGIPSWMAVTCREVNDPPSLMGSIWNMTGVVASPGRTKYA